MVKRIAAGGLLIAALNLLGFFQPRIKLFIPRRTGYNEISA
jgi:hypothetical protein